LNKRGFFGVRRFIAAFQAFTQPGSGAKAHLKVVSPPFPAAQKAVMNHPTPKGRLLWD
jgi:hypothetical protein